MPGSPAWDEVVTNCSQCSDPDNPNQGLECNHPYRVALYLYECPECGVANISVRANGRIVPHEPGLGYVPDLPWEVRRCEASNTFATRAYDLTQQDDAQDKVTR
jgi:hypothetical protein